MSKSADAFRTISEVAEWLDTPTHVLRFWESKFPQVKPVKRAGGRRYYRPKDMELLAGIKKLLHEDGVTIRGVQKILREQGVLHVVQVGYELNEGQNAPLTPVDAAEEPKVVPLRPVLEVAAPAVPKLAPPPPDTDTVTNIFANLEDDEAPMLFASQPGDSTPQEITSRKPLPGASPSFLSTLPAISSNLRRIPSSELTNRAEKLRAPIGQLRNLRNKIAASLAASPAAARD
jgi:DNA-binding transcriptional MerR regulator